MTKLQEPQVSPDLEKFLAGEGYRDYIDPRKRMIIDRALALCSITDNEGTIHENLIPRGEMNGR